MSRVEKLDNPEIFDEIKTGIKSITTLKKHEQQVYNVWFNFYFARNELVPDKKGPLQWIADHHAKIEKHIRDTYVEPKYKPSSLRNHLEGLSNILLAIDKNKFKEVVRPMFNTGLSVQQIIDKAGEDSVMTEQEMKNFVPFEDLVVERDRLLAEWAKAPKDLKLNMYSLILCLNTMWPPIRLDYVGMEIWPKRLVDGVPRKVVTSDPPPSDTKTNFLWEYAPGKWASVLNYDKIQHSRDKSGKERQIMKFEEEIPGVTKGSELNAIITRSVELVPRNEVLRGVKTGLPMGVTSYDSALGEMFKPRKPRQNLIRKAYVNFWYRKELSVGVLKQIADHMRHSVSVALGSYRKIGISAPSLIVEDEEKKEPPTVVAPPTVVIPIIAPSTPAVIPIIAPTEVKLAPMAPPKKLFDYVEYNREYRLKHAKELNKKQSDKYEANKQKILAAKIVRKLNNMQSTRPIEASILQYGLKQNPHTGKWSSGLIPVVGEE